MNRSAKGYKPCGGSTGALLSSLTPTPHHKMAWPLLLRGDEKQPSQPSWWTLRVSRKINKLLYEVIVFVSCRRLCSVYLFIYLFSPLLEMKAPALSMSIEVLWQSISWGALAALQVGMLSGYVHCKEIQSTKCKYSKGKLQPKGHQFRVIWLNSATRLQVKESEQPVSSGLLYSLKIWCLCFLSSYTHARLYCL